MKPVTTFLIATAIGVAVVFAYSNFSKTPKALAEQQDSLHPTKAEASISSEMLTKTQRNTLEILHKKNKADIQTKGLLTLDEKDLDVSSLTLEPKMELPGEPGSLWTITDIKPSSGSIILNEKIQTREPITFYQAESAAVRVGDIISLSLPGANHYQAVVDHLSINANGETTWTGYIKGTSTNYPVIFTIGATNSFATITTPKGLYAMEAVNKSGWIYKTPDLLDLFNPNHPDQLVIDQ